MYRNGGIWQDGEDMNRAARRSKDGRDKAKAYKDPVPPRGPKTGPEENVSWLGRWEDNGWAIRIGRKLTEEEWKVVGDHAEETWNDEDVRYDPYKSMVMMDRLFPDEDIALVWPRCNHRTPFEIAGKRKISCCPENGVHFDNVYIASGLLVGVARCEAHRGRL